MASVKVLKGTKRAANELEIDEIASLAASEILVELRNVNYIVDQLHHDFTTENTHSKKRHHALIDANTILKRTLLQGFRMQRLQWGIAHAKYGSFRYGHESMQSSS